MPNLLGKTNIGLNGVTYFSIFFPFINIWKHADYPQVTNNGLNYFGSTPQGKPMSPWGVYLEPDTGELINPQAANTTGLVKLVYSQPVNGLPVGYPGLTGSRWVLKWDGDPALTLSVPLTSVTRNGARAVGTWPSDTSNQVYFLQNFSLSNPPRNIRLCRLEHETLLDQGEIFNPEYVAMCKRASGLARFMDWSVQNNNRVNNSNANIVTESSGGWCQTAATPGIPGGCPISVMSKLAIRANSHPWVCVPTPLGVGKFWSIGNAQTVTITVASPGVITWAQHGLAADRQVFFTSNGSLPTGITSGTTYYVVGASITTNTFQISATAGGAAINTSGSQSGTQTGNIVGITLANPAVVWAPGHPFVDGDSVIPYRAGGVTRSSTITMTIATPCVVTWTSHGLAAGANVIITTTNTLPTPLISGQSYYVLASGLTTDAFQIARTPGGAAINTSGSQSGTHAGSVTVNRNKYIVANTVAGVSFELQGCDSTTFSAYSGSGWMMSPFSLASMTTQGVLFFSHFRDSIALPLTPRFEFGNETWNAGIFDAFHQFAAQAHNFLNASDDQVFPGDNGIRMAGYFAAHFMKTARDAYGVSNRTRWKGILPTQTVNTGVTTDYLAGINRYIADIAPALTLADLFDLGAVTGYFGSNQFNGSNKAVTINVGTSTFTANGHGYPNNRIVKLTTTGALPTPLAISTFYWTTNVTTNTFQLSATALGSAMALSGTQSGTHNVFDASGDWLIDIMNTSIARFNDGLEATRYSYYQRVYNEDTLDARWTGQPFSLDKAQAFMAAQKAIFDSNGLGTTQYEGGFAADYDAWNGNPNFALVNEFFPRGVYCPENAAIHTAMYTGFVATGAEFPAKFVDVAPPTRFGCFGAAQWIGNGNPVWEATCDFNDKLWSGRLR